MVATIESDFQLKIQSTGWEWEKCLLKWGLIFGPRLKAQLASTDPLQKTHGYQGNRKEERKGGERGGQERDSGLASEYYLCIHLLNPSVLSQSHLPNDSVSQSLFKNKSRFPTRDSFITPAPNQNWGEGKISLMIMEMLRQTENRVSWKEEEARIRWYWREKARRWCGFFPGKGQSLRWCRSSLHRHGGCCGSLPRPPLPDDLWTLIFSYA